MGLLKRIEFWREERRIHKTYAGRGEEADADYSGEIWELDQKRQRYSDRKLIAKARRYYVPIPDESDKDGFWKEQDEGNWFLTDKGVSHLRKAIREEKKAIRESWLAWMPLILTLTGLIGALSGLVALLSK